MSFKSALSWVGHEAGAVFSWLASDKGQTTVATIEGAVTAGVTAVDPAAGAALAGIVSLVNVGLKQVVSAEVLSVAAAQQDGTGAQKAAAVVAALSSEVSATLQSLGVKQPTSAQVQSISQVIATSLANIVNAFPASTK